MSKKILQKINPTFEWRFLQPQFWPVWLLVGCWWLMVQLPYPLLVWLGRGLGRLLLLGGKTRRLIAIRNLEICFPEKTPIERKQILKASFESGGVAFMEMGMAWWWPNERLKKICHIEGLEHIEQLNGQGAVLLGMHFTTLDMGGTGLSLYKSYGSMYRPHRNAVINYVMFRGRCRINYRSKEDELVIFPREDIRTMVRLLREGKLVWYAPDQDYGEQYSVFAPFFGIPAATITATAKLVQMGRAAVLPFTHTRLPKSQGYRITVHPPLQNYPSGNEVEDATRINQMVESFIRQNPEQYLWAHRRFKSRPAEAPDRYPALEKVMLVKRIERKKRRKKAKKKLNKKLNK